jgi:hypothetical protein
MLQYQRPRGSAELHVSTRGGLVGVRTLWALRTTPTTRTSAGLEVYALTATDGGGRTLGPLP